MNVRYVRAGQSARITRFSFHSYGMMSGFDSREDGNNKYIQIWQIHYPKYRS